MFSKAQRAFENIITYFAQNNNIQIKNIKVRLSKNDKLYPLLMEKQMTCVSRVACQDEPPSTTRVATRVVGCGWDVGVVSLM